MQVLLFSLDCNCYIMLCNICSLYKSYKDELFLVSCKRIFHLAMNFILIVLVDTELLNVQFTIILPATSITSGDCTLTIVLLEDFELWIHEWLTRSFIYPFLNRHHVDSVVSWSPARIKWTASYRSELEGALNGNR